MIAGDICCQKKQTEPILVEGEWSYDNFKTDTFTVMYDREGANGLRYSDFDKILENCYGSYVFELAKDF